MIITINNNIEKYPGERISVAELVRLRNLKPQGTAVAHNGKFGARDSWEQCMVSDGDSLTIISAAFGG